MSNSENTAQVRLIVRAEDPATEIFLVDSQFQLAGRGVGTLEQAVPPGIYKLKSRIGTQTREEPLILRPTAEPVSRTIAPLEFSSSAPLEHTYKTHETHMGAAAQHSHRTHVQAGS